MERADTQHSIKRTDETEQLQVHFKALIIRPLY